MNLVDESLTRLRSVSKSKHRIYGFKHSEWGYDRRFFAVLGRDRYLMASAYEVDLRKDTLIV
jgi:fibronectin type 3 domain-containing protein